MYSKPCLKKQQRSMDPCEFVARVVEPARKLLSFHLLYTIEMAMRRVNNIRK